MIYMSQAFLMLLGISFQVINFSTGRVINKVLFENEITAMDNAHTGQLIFAGDTQVCIYSFGNISLV